MLINHQDQQSLLWNAWNLKLCFGTNVGTHPAKIEEISISRVILLCFLHSLASAIQCEANMVHLRCTCISVGKDPEQNLEFLYTKCTDSTPRINKLTSTGFFWAVRTQELLSKWESVDLFLHCLCGPQWLGPAWAMLWQWRPGTNSKRLRSRRGPQKARCNRIPACPLLYIAAGPCAQISPNCQHKLEFLVGTLASWLCVVSCAWGGLVLQCCIL